jgi:RNA-directed DNA polymerase
MKFTALLHHLTVDLLRESLYSLKRKAAPGVDGVTWQEYETGLEDRLVDLHGPVHRGASTCNQRRQATYSFFITLKRAFYRDLSQL